MSSSYIEKEYRDEDEYITRLVSVTYSKVGLAITKLVVLKEYTEFETYEALSTLYELSQQVVISKILPTYTLYLLVNPDDYSLLCDFHNAYKISAGKTDEEIYGEPPSVNQDWEELPPNDQKSDPFDTRYRPSDN